MKLRKEVTTAVLIALAVVLLPLSGQMTGLSSFEPSYVEYRGGAV